MQRMQHPTQLSLRQKTNRRHGVPLDRNETCQVFCEENQKKATLSCDFSFGKDETKKGANSKITIESETNRKI